MSNGNHLQILRLAKKLCAQNVDKILNDLIAVNLIHPESNFFSEARNRIFNTCLYSLYPVMEFYSNFPEDNSEFFLYNSYLFAYTFFLDHSLDFQTTTSTEVRSYQISSYFLLKYYKWFQNYGINESVFYKYYHEQTDYLIKEKKWDFPDLYLEKYVLPEQIHKKVIILFLPFKLLKGGYEKIKLIRNVIKDYYSFILLADDIIDFDEDINNKCLTYPIVYYYSLTGSFPDDSEDISLVLPRLISTLEGFKTNIKKQEKLIGKSSLIIKQKLNSLMTVLNREADIEL